MTILSTNIQILDKEEPRALDQVNLNQSTYHLILNAINDMNRYISDMIVVDEWGYKKVTSIYSNAREWKKSIEEKRKAIGEPLRKQLAKVNDSAKSLTDPLDQVIHIANAKASSYQKLLEEQKKEEALSLKQAAALLDISEDELYIQPLDSTLRGEGATATTTVKKKFKVVDMAAVPRKYLMVDEKAIERDMKLGIDNIDGIEFYEEKQTTLRVR